MLILAKAQAKDPGRRATRRRSSPRCEDVLGTCLERGHQDRLQRGRAQPGRARRGDPERGGDSGWRERRATSRATTCAARSARSRPPVAGKPVSANAYLGGWGIAEALARGRRRRRHRAGHRRVARRRAGGVVARLGAATDWDALAGAVVAGHVIECGPQATGGNYAFLDEITDRRYPGFPIAEVAADGSSVITKHPGTGGLVSVGTVTAQLLYEIAGARLPRPGRHHALRHHRADAGRRAPRRDHRGAREPAAGDAEGRAQRRRRLPQHDDARAHRPGHRGQGRARRGAAVRGARRPGPLRRGRRAAAAVRPPRRADQRPGHRAPAHHRQGPRPAQGRPGLLQRDDGAGARRLRGLPHHHAADRASPPSASTARAAVPRRP